ncbi:MAG: hypothetical protein KAG14_03260, partial [Mycoplasmataceae bacterium]|nr:hypothetical protein [Mycoplasmataceae bacterium]
FSFVPEYLHSLGSLVTRENIDPDKPIRDTFPDDILKEIEEAEKDMYGYIKYREVTEYEELKRLILQ